MDTMILEGKFVQLIIEKLLKKAIKKHCGIKSDLSVTDFKLVLDGEECGAMMKVNGKITAEDKKKILNSFFGNKGEA